MDEDATPRPSGYTENFLEKIINQRSTESADTPVQPKRMNRLQTLQAKRMSMIQAKLSIGEPNDKYEQEADATASKVVQQINSPTHDQSVQREEAMEEAEDEELQMKPISSIQREWEMEEEMDEDEEVVEEVVEEVEVENENENEELQMKPISSIQREESTEEENEELQMKSLEQRRENLGGGEASTDLESSIQSARAGGQSLDASLQNKMGQAMGADFSDVKVHTDTQSDQLNHSIQSKAFTTGQDVFFRQGEYNPSSKGGQELIAHELTHVVQQNRSTIQRKLMTEGEFVNKSDSAFSGKRNNVVKIDNALKKCHGASSRSVGLTELIGACNEYLSAPEKKAKKRIAGVKALLKNATDELAAWRLRDRAPLPESVYRMDERLPAVISKVGFQPWNAGGNITIVEHVNQVLANNRDVAPTGESGKAGSGAKKHSQYVSTSGNLNFAKDPILLQGLLNKYFYKIDTTVDPQTFTDVNKHFDDQGLPNPYEPQFEFIKSGGIPGNQVTYFVNGRALMDFVIAGTDASTWVIPWEKMPEVKN